jgi:hypothetical protein
LSSRACCELHDDGARIANSRFHLLGRRGAKTAGWVVPSVVMVLMPKCPACVVAYLAIAGMGISMSAAEGLRLVVLGICGVLIGYFVVVGLMRRVRV